MSTPNDRQRGMTYVGILLVLCIIAFFAMVAIKVVPLYVENFTINSSLKSLSQDAGAGGKSEMEIRDTLLKRFAVNNVEHATKDDVKIGREGHNTVVSVSYEARVPLFANIDLVATFDNNRVELTATPPAP